MGLFKEHSMDAVAIASQGKDVRFKTNLVLKKKCVSDGDYQQKGGIHFKVKYYIEFFKYTNDFLDGG